MLNLLLVAQAILAPVMPADTVTRFGVVGDNQGNNFNTFGAICATLATERLDCFIGLGDHTQSGGPASWLNEWTRPLAPISNLTRFGCIGNHDQVQEYVANFWPITQHALTSPYGNAVGCWAAVTVGSVRWVFLDTNEAPAIRISLAPGGAQHAWLLAETASAEWRTARFRIAAWHHPCLTELWDGGCNYPCPPERRWLLDHLSVAGASLCLHGHSHSYQRGSWRGMPFVISGGGGGWLDTTRCWDHPEISVSIAAWHYLTIEAGEALTVVAKTPQGVEFDRLVIR